MTTLEADVLVLGGGPAGTWAAVTAARDGASVVLADKGYCGTSGATASVDHWDLLGTDLTVIAPGTFSAHPDLPHAWNKARAAGVAAMNANSAAYNFVGGHRRADTGSGRYDRDADLRLSR
jgi:glycine/D-amino acid oxidase-like deaminating enzyme